MDGGVVKRGETGEAGAEIGYNLPLNYAPVSQRYRNFVFGDA